MSIPLLRQIGDAMRNLNPHEVHTLADRPVRFGVLAADEGVAQDIIDQLVPPDVSEETAEDAKSHLLRIADETDFDRCTAGFAERGVPHPANFYRYDSARPQATIDQLLEEREDDWLALARRFPGLRDDVSERIVWKICKENALFTVATAVPNVVPSFITIPWAAGEFASDTAFLTMNQVRMAFLIAAANDADIGYREQSGQIASIIAAAFGWRTLARNLVGKIPAGGGLVSKGLVSFAGTYVIGKGLEHYFRLGRPLSRSERKRLYAEAYQRGRSAVEEIAGRVVRRSGTNLPAAESR